MTAFSYTIAAHPTVFDGVQYRSRLEARWAAFFALAGWKADYEPVDFEGWTPDFLVEFPCGWSSDCDTFEYGARVRGSHSLLVEVKPFTDLQQFKGHIVWELVHHGCATPDPVPAIFGLNPEVTYWELVCGSGGGAERLMDRVPQWRTHWKDAGRLVQWKPRP